MAILQYGPDGVTARPPHAEGARPWATNPSAPGAGDGTIITAEWLNAVRGLIVTAITGMGVSDNSYADDLLLQAIQAAIGEAVSIDTGDAGSAFSGDGTAGDPLGLDFSTAAASLLANATVPGVIELATNAEALAGSDAVRAITAASMSHVLKNQPFLRYPAYATVVSLTTNAPPGTPAVDDLYVVGPGPSGDWAGNALDFARWNGSQWEFRTAKTGQIALANDTGTSWQWNGAAWILYAPWLAAVQAINDGDILISLDSSPQPGFVELDGAQIVGGATTYPNVAARYPWMVSAGDIFLLDTRGEFLRGWNNGRGADPDAASRTARPGDSATGDVIGTGQLDQIVAHVHTHGISYWMNYGTYMLGGAGGLGFNVYAPPSTGGNETRGRNVGVMFQMKMG